MISIIWNVKNNTTRRYFMIKQLFAIATIAFLAGCSFIGGHKDVVNESMTYGHYKPVFHSQVIVDELVDNHKNVIHVPMHVISNATYWRDGYYVIPNIFLDNANSCENCLVSFIKADYIQGVKDSQTEHVEWRERQPNEYTFSGWLGRDGAVHYAYLLDLDKSAVEDQFALKFNVTKNHKSRTAHIANVSPAGIMSGAPLIGVDQKIIGMTIEFDNIPMKGSNTFYLSKSEIEKDWTVFNQHKK